MHVLAGLKKCFNTKWYYTFGSDKFFDLKFRKQDREMGEKVKIIKISLFLGSILITVKT